MIQPTKPRDPGGPAADPSDRPAGVAPRDPNPDGPPRDSERGGDPPGDTAPADGDADPPQGQDAADASRADTREDGPSETDGDDDDPPRAKDPVTDDADPPRASRNEDRRDDEDPPHDTADADADDPDPPRDPERAAADATSDTDPDAERPAEDAPSDPFWYKGKTFEDHALNGLTAGYDDKEAMAKHDESVFTSPQDHPEHRTAHQDRKGPLMSMLGTSPAPAPQGDAKRPDAKEMARRILRANRRRRPAQARASRPKPNLRSSGGPMPGIIVRRR